MRIRALLAAFLITGLWPLGASGQSLSPMHKKGFTPSDIKGFRVRVGNPYKTRMAFTITPMDTGFKSRAPNAVARPDRLILAPGFSRQILIAFKIEGGAKERTIGLCISPEHIAGPILPRVCGTYTGVALVGAGR